VKPNRFRLGIAILASALAIYLTLFLSLASSEIAATPTTFSIDGRAAGGESGVLTVSLFRLLGYSAFAIPLGLFYFSWHLVAQNGLQQGLFKELLLRLTSVIIILSSASGLANLFTGGNTDNSPGGGIIGSLVSAFLTHLFSREFSAVILFLLFLLNLGRAVRGRWFAVMEDIDGLVRRIFGAG
jgi:hypothetical protein